MIEGLQVVMDALQGVSLYAAIVAVIYLVLELLKVVIMYGAPVWAVYVMAKHVVLWGNREVKKVTLKKIQLNRMSITVDGTNDDFEDFLEEVISSPIGGKSSVIHNYHIEHLRKAWKYYVEEHKRLRKESVTRFGLFCEVPNGDYLKAASEQE